MVQGTIGKKIVNLLLRNIDNKLDMSPGNQQLDMVYIDDVVDSFIIAAQILMTSKIKYEEYGISSGRVLSLRELVEILTRISGHKINVCWSSKPYRNREVMEVWSTNKHLPGWNPKIQLEQGLFNTWKWIDRNKYSFGLIK
jgi:nucleoside-diphosphate-sugar epimerase